MKKTPKLRFNEFSGDWESKKLEEVTNYVDYRGKTPPKSGQGIFLVTAKNIKNGYIDYSASKEFISEQSYNEAMRRGLPKKGDVLLTTEAPLGNVAQIDREDIALAQRVIKFRGTDELDNTYLKYYFLSEKFQNKLFTKAIGTTVLGIQGKVLHKMPVSFPIIEEQEKIASFVYLVDSKASLQGEKVDALKDYKRGIIQKIFTGKLRFKDDDGRDYPEWEEKKLINYTEKITTKNKDFTITNVISNSAKNGLISQRDFFDKDIANQSNIDGYYVIEPGDFVYNPRKSSESPYGPINRYGLQDAGVVSPLYLCFRVNNEEINGKFLAYYFKSSVWHRFIYQNSDQGARHDRVSIKDAEFFNMEIGVPDIDEQNKIVKFLDSLECKLSKEQDKLEYLIEYKKGLLQQMFI